jgi:hypothetical protein
MGQQPTETGDGEACDSGFDRKAGTSFSEDVFFKMLIEVWQQFLKTVIFVQVPIYDTSGE